jgi:hypothetical protein
MAKTAGGSNLLVDKGEKIGLGIGAVVGVLLLVLGLMSAFDRPQDPKSFSQAVDQKASQLTSQMNAPNAEIEPTSSDLDKPANRKPEPVVANLSNYFDPTPVPDPRRISPVVLRVKEGQVDMVALKILANDFKFDRDSDGNITKIRVGVVTAKDPDKKLDEGKVSNFLKDVKDKLGNKIPKQRKMPGAGMPGFPPGSGDVGGPPGGGFPPGGPPPGAGFVGGPPGTGMAGFAPGGGGARGGPPGAGFAGGFGGDIGGSSFSGYGAPGGNGRREEVQYIEGETDEDIEKQLGGRRLAITIHPQKAVVLQAAFPYRAELEKFKDALRYQSIKDLFNHPDDLPVFNGVDLQRQIYKPNGDLVENWQSIDLAANSQALRAVKLFYDDDPTDLKRVMLHEDHQLVMPLPHAIAGKYPEMKLKSLKDSIEKQKQLDPKGQNAPAPKSKYGGEGNPFKRDNLPAGLSGLYNPTGEGGGFGGPGGAGPGGFLPPPPSKKTNTSDGPPKEWEPPENVFVRVYDTDIRDGYVYAYRMRVRVKNPNYGRKTDTVAKQSDADPEELPPLDEHWFEFPQKVQLPRAGYYYVVDPTPPSAKVANPLPAPRDGQAVVQFQRWFDYLSLSEKLEEPIGDWVVSEMLVTRGQFVGGKAFATVPFWSSVENAFVLREVQGDKAPPKGKEPRRGAMIEPIPPRLLLVVDVGGGKVRPKVQPNPGQPTNRGGVVDDEAAAEVLFLDRDGTLEVKSSAHDKPDADRKEREENFKKWVDDTNNKVPVGGPPGKKGKDDF